MMMMMMCVWGGTMATITVDNAHTRTENTHTKALAKLASQVLSKQHNTGDLKQLVQYNTTHQIQRTLTKENDWVISETPTCADDQLVLNKEDNSGPPG